MGLLVFADKSLKWRSIPNDISKEKNCLRLQGRGSAGPRYTDILVIFRASIADKVKHSVGTGSAQSVNQ